MARFRFVERFLERWADADLKARIDKLQARNSDLEHDNDKLRKEIELRDLEITRLVDINERDRARILAENAAYVRAEKISENLPINLQAVR